MDHTREGIVRVFLHTSFTDSRPFARQLDGPDSLVGLIPTGMKMNHTHEGIVRGFLHVFFLDSRPFGRPFGRT